MTAKKKRRSTGYFGKALVAAIIVSMLAVTASAAESTENWFVKFFGGLENLNQKQVQYLQENNQILPPVQEDVSMVHRDVLQFADGEILFQADINNTHVTGEGAPDYQNVKLSDLTLWETGARLNYLYFEGMDWTKDCSISHLTVVLSSGEEITMPIAGNQQVMDFASESPIPLEQVDHIRLPDGVEVNPINQVEDGYVVSLDSVLTDSQTIYITLNLTIPENLEAPGPGWTLEDSIHVLDMWLCPAEQEKPALEELILWTSGVKILEDGDGKDHTKKMMVEMTRNGTQPLVDIAAEWKLHISGVEAVWHNSANEDALFNEKYAGQDVLLDGEEVAMTILYETLCWDTWDFRLDLGSNAQSGEVELVTEPVALSGYREAMREELQKNPEQSRVGPFDIQLVSFRISPLSYYIEYTAEDDYNAQTVDVGAYTLVMRDGTELELFRYSGRHAFAQPIVLSEVDHILLPNGRKLRIPE